MSGVEVVGLGSCTVDFFAIVPKLIGGEEKVNVERLEIHAGGVTANNLTQVARLGAATGWFGLIGDDENGRIIREAFAADHFDTTAVEVVPGERSSFTWIPVDRAGERSIYMFPNVTAKVTPGQIRERFGAYIRQARHLHTEASQLPMPPVLEAVRIARQAGVRVIFDLDVEAADFIAADLGTEAELMEALRGSDVLKPCKAAARALSGEHDPERMARKLLSMGPKLVALTLGVDGCLIASSDSCTHQPAFPVKVVDTTGAGDAFMGGLSFGLLREFPLERVAQFANACAALCCTQVGARAMAFRPEVEELIASRAVSPVRRA